MEFNDGLRIALGAALAGIIWNKRLWADLRKQWSRRSGAGTSGDGGGIPLEKPPDSNR